MRFLLKFSHDDRTLPHREMRGRAPLQPAVAPTPQPDAVHIPGATPAQPQPHRLSPLGHAQRSPGQAPALSVLLHTLLFYCRAEFFSKQYCRCFVA